MPTRAQYQILPGGRAEGPIQYSLQGAEQFELLQVIASYDGTGSLGNYRPAVEFFSNSTDSIGIMPITSVVSSGFNVDATWFPGAGGSVDQAPAAQVFPFHRVGALAPGIVLSPGYGILVRALKENVGGDQGGVIIDSISFMVRDIGDIGGESVPMPRLVPVENVV